MNTIKSLLASLLVVSATVNLSTFNNATFVSSVPTLDTAVIRSSMLSDLNKPCEDHKDDCDSCGSLKVGFGFSQSYKSGDFTAFGVADSNTINYRSNRGSTDVPLTDVIRSKTTAGATASDLNDGVLTLDPKKTVVYVHGAFFCDLKQFVADGAWASVETAFARQKNDLRAVVTGGAVSTNGALSLSDFLSGASSSVAGTAGFEGPLKYAKIPTEAPSAEQGIADVHVYAGYNAIKNSSGTFGGFLKAVLPTGNKETAVNLFGNKYGQNHLGLGAGFNGKVSLVENKNYNAALGIFGDYVYYLSATEKRVLGLNAATGLEHGHYHAVSQAASSVAASTTIVPAANVLYQEVDVKPQGKFNGTAMFFIGSDNFDFNVGYNLRYEQAESNALKNASWSNGTYYLLENSTEAPIATTAVPAVAGREIKDTDVVFNLDSQTVHTALTEVGYSVDGDYPVRLSLGGSLDFAVGDKALSQKMWNVFGRVALSF